MLFYFGLPPERMEFQASQSSTRQYSELTMSDNTLNEPRAARQNYADQLEEFNSQSSWYNSRATAFKNRAQRLDILIIIAGALVSALPAIGSNLGATAETTVDIALVALGVTIVVSQGLQRVFRYSEIWPEYRLASERMKREWRLFINSAPPYNNSEDKARGDYVSRLDAIMADEQKIFFDRQRDLAKSETDPLA